MSTRAYPLVAGLSLAASVLLLAFPLQAAACPDAKPAAQAAAPITDPNHPRFAAQMVELYRQWGQSRPAVAQR